MEINRYNVYDHYQPLNLRFIKIRILINCVVLSTVFWPHKPYISEETFQYTAITYYHISLNMLWCISVTCELVYLFLYRKFESVGCGPRDPVIVLQ